MNKCDGCQMNVGNQVVCLFHNDLRCGYITRQILYECPCNTCLVKVTCRFDYCEQYKFYYDKLTKYFKIYRLEHNQPYHDVYRNVACMSRLIIFHY